MGRLRNSRRQQTERSSNLMTGFSVDWLDLREAADQLARDDKLLQQAVDWVATNKIGRAHV